MKTNTIILALYGNPLNVEKISGRYDCDLETNQLACYTVENGLATIISLTPTIKTVVSLPLPFVLPVNDLGSGMLTKIEINADTLTPHMAICPTQKWADARPNRAPLTIQQTLIADYNALL